MTVTNLFFEIIQHVLTEIIPVFTLQYYNLIILYILGLKILGNKFLILNRIVI